MWIRSQVRLSCKHFKLGLKSFCKICFAESHFQFIISDPKRVWMLHLIEELFTITEVPRKPNLLISITEHFKKPNAHSLATSITKRTVQLSRHYSLDNWTSSLLGYRGTTVTYYNTFSGQKIFLFCSFVASVSRCECPSQPKLTEVAYVMTECSNMWPDNLGL